MKKKKFYFDKDTGDLIPVKKSKRNTAKLIFSVIFLTLFFSAFGIALGYHYLIKPKTSGQAHLASELEKMEIQYRLLNKKFEQTQHVLADLEERDDNIYRSFFELTPIPADVRKAGFGGTDRYENFSNLRFGDLVTETSKNLDIINKRLVIQSKSLDDVLVAAKDKEEMFKHIPAIQPVANKNLNREK